MDKSNNFMYIGDTASTIQVWGINASYDANNVLTNMTWMPVRNISLPT
jgi:hypothetical protein